MAKIKTDMSSLAMPNMGIAIMGKDSPAEDRFPCLDIRTQEKLDLPDGDFFFLAIGHVKRTEEMEEDDGTMCYRYGVEVHAIQPISSVADEKVIEKPDGSIEDDFEKAANKMQSLKEEDSVDEESDDGEGDY